PTCPLYNFKPYLTGYIIHSNLGGFFGDASIHSNTIIIDHHLYFLRSVKFRSIGYSKRDAFFDGTQQHAQQGPGLRDGCHERISGGG
ncbi:MAG TPA: hypothetical protein VJ991_15115, partial [Balneolales bacterium]|nr:hypothetical protein [Balneolales bacterium]